MYEQSTCTTEDQEGRRARLDTDGIQAKLDHSRIHICHQLICCFVVSRILAESVVTIKCLNCGVKQRKKSQKKGKDQ